MEANDIKIGGKYYLIPAKEAYEIDERFQENGYSNRCGTYTSGNKMEHFGKDKPITILRPNTYDTRRPDSCWNAKFPDGREWVVCIEWLLEEPYSTKPKAPKQPKSKVRLIRGRIPQR